MSQKFDFSGSNVKEISVDKFDKQGNLPGMNGKSIVLEVGEENPSSHKNSQALTGRI